MGRCALHIVMRLSSWKGEISTRSWLALCAYSLIWHQRDEWVIISVRSWQFKWWRRGRADRVRGTIRSYIWLYRRFEKQMLWEEHKRWWILGRNTITPTNSKWNRGIPDSSLKLISPNSNTRCPVRKQLGKQAKDILIMLWIRDITLNMYLNILPI